MAKRGFISFDFNHDEDLGNLLAGQRRTLNRLRHSRFDVEGARVQVVYLNRRSGLNRSSQRLTHS